MKVLHLTDVFASIGGAENYLIDLLPLLESMSLQNVVVYRREHAHAPAADCRPTYHVPRSDNPHADYEAVAKIILKEKPTVVYLHALYDPHLISQVARRMPTVAYIQSHYAVCPGLMKYLPRGEQVCTRTFGLGCIPTIYLRRCASARHPLSVYRIVEETRSFEAAYRQVSLLLVGSKYMRGLLALEHFDVDRIKVLPPHFQEPRSGPPPEQDPPLILFAGRLEIEKGLPYLLRALAGIARPWRLVVAGDGSRRQEYHELACRLHITDRVSFVGWLRENELDRLYQRASLLVVPSVWPEPFGKVGVEAMAHGRPVVAFDVGGIGDWLTDGCTGFLVTPKDIRGLAEKIQLVLFDPSLANALGTRGQEEVKRRYSTRQHGEAVLGILNSVAGTGDQPKPSLAA